MEDSASVALYIMKTVIFLKIAKYNMINKKLSHWGWTNKQGEGANIRYSLVLTFRNPAKTLNWKPYYVCRGPGADLCMP